MFSPALQTVGISAGTFINVAVSPAQGPYSRCPHAPGKPTHPLTLSLTTQAKKKALAQKAKDQAKADAEAAAAADDAATTTDEMKSQ